MLGMTVIYSDTSHHHERECVCSKHLLLDVVLPAADQRLELAERDRVSIPLLPNAWPSMSSCRDWTGQKRVNRRPYQKPERKAVQRNFEGRVVYVGVCEEHA